MRDVFHYNECIGPRPARVRSIAGPYTILNRSRETGAGRGADASRDARDGTRRARPREAPQPMARARYGDLDPVERSAGCSCRDPETRLSFSAPTPQRFQDARHTACFVSAYFRERGGVRVLFIKVCENEGCRRASFCGKNNSPLQEPPVQPLKKRQPPPGMRNIK